MTSTIEKTRRSERVAGNSAGAKSQVKNDPPASALVPSQTVGLRIPDRLLLVVKTKWVVGGDRYQPSCQELLEQALLERSSAADEWAAAFAAGDLSGRSEPTADLAEIPSDADRSAVTVTLSSHAYTIATKLGLREGKSLSIQKVCEPLLCEELRKRRDEAIDAANAILSALQEPEPSAGAT